MRPDREQMLNLIEGRDRLCDVCRFRVECPRGVMGGPFGPIYPPCIDGGDRFIDEDRLEEVYREEVEAD